MRLKLPPLGVVHTNIALLVSAFAVGQGAMFCVQTYLIAKGNAAFLGTAGVAYYTVVLVYMLADWGGVLTLTRTVASARDVDAGSTISEAYWSLALVRVGLIILAVPILVLVANKSHRGFELAFAIAASIGLPAHAFNANGILDGRGRSGVAGVLAVLPVLLFAGALGPAASLHPEVAGLLLGGGYSIGIVLSTALQLVMVRHYGIHLQGINFRFSLAVKSFYSGATYLAAILPGQLFFRGQLWLAHNLIGPSGAGVLVYAKQLLNAAMQLLQFVRRAEFPQLVAAISKGTDIRTASFAAQKTGLVLSILGCAALLIFSLGLSLIVERTRPAAYLIAAFAPLVVTGSIYLGLQQGYAAADRILVTVPVTWTYVIASLAATYVIIETMSQYAFPIAEGVGQVLAAVALLALMRRFGAHSSARHHPAEGKPQPGDYE